MIRNGAHGPDPPGPGRSGPCDLLQRADGEVSRHIPRVWDTATPEAALAAREQGSAAVRRRLLDDLADAPSLARAAELATKAATSAPTEGPSDESA